MEECYRRLEQKPYDSFYLYVEATFDCPIEKVWTQALDIPSWMTAHRLETIDGESGTVGHFVKVHPRNLAADTPSPHYHLYGIANLIPLKAIILEVFPEQGGSYGKTRPTICFDTILFTDLGGRTHVAVYLIDVQLEKGDEEFRARRQVELEGSRAKLTGYFENLRRLL